MIIDALLMWILVPLNGVLDGLGKFDASNFVLSLEAVTAMNYFLPVQELMAVFISFFVLGVPMLTITIATWFVVGVLRGGTSKA